MGDADAAAPLFTRMLQQDPNDDDAKYNLGLIDYLKWAKANPNRTSAASLDAIQKRNGLKKEDAFVVSATYDGLAVVTSAMLRVKAIKNINVVCSSACGNQIPNISALLNATYSDNSALAKELVEHGANVNAHGAQGKTALIYALFNTDVDLVAYLLKKGARVNVNADDGLTPLSVAVISSPQSKKLVSLLLKYKADPMGVDGTGRTMPFVAIMDDSIGAIDALITEGKIDVNLRNPYQMNLLSYALDRPDILRLLLSKGADPWQPVLNGDILDYARASMRPAADTAKVVAILEEARKNRPKK
jgi:ankyrin repeat protein